MAALFREAVIRVAAITGTPGRGVDAAHHPGSAALVPLGGPVLVGLRQRPQLLYPRLVGELLRTHFSRRAGQPGEEPEEALRPLVLMQLGMRWGRLPERLWSPPLHISPQPAESHRLTVLQAPGLSEIEQ